MLIQLRGDFPEAVVCAIVVLDCIILEDVLCFCVQPLADALFDPPIILHLKEGRRTDRELDHAKHNIRLGKKEIEIKLELTLFLWRVTVFVMSLRVCVCELKQHLQFVMFAVAWQEVTGGTGNGVIVR